MLDELSIFGAKATQLTPKLVHGQTFFGLPALVSLELLGLLLRKLEEFSIDMRQSHVVPHCVFDLVHETIKLVHSSSLPSEIGAFRDESAVPNHFLLGAEERILSLHHALPVVVCKAHPRRLRGSTLHHASTVFAIKETFVVV